MKLQDAKRVLLSDLVRGLLVRIDNGEKLNESEIVDQIVVCLEAPMKRGRKAKVVSLTDAVDAADAVAAADVEVVQTQEAAVETANS